MLYHYGDTCIVGGDLSDGGPELRALKSDCWAAWGYPSTSDAGCQKSIIVILGRGSTANNICGVAAPAVHASSSACTDPRNVSNNTSGAFAFVATKFTDLGLSDCTGVAQFILPHELGHTLGLGHGDGLDDDCNGVWDSDCDPTEMEAGPQTLMTAEGGATSFLTPLQLDRARVYATKSLPAAAATSNCVAPPPPTPPTDTTAPPPPPPSGCGCRVGDSSRYGWFLPMIAIVFVARRRTSTRGRRR